MKMLSIITQSRFDPVTGYKKRIIGFLFLGFPVWHKEYKYKAGLSERDRVMLEAEAVYRETGMLLDEWEARCLRIVNQNKGKKLFTLRKSLKRKSSL